MSTNPAGVAFIALSIPTPFEGASFQEFLVWKLINGTDEGDEGTVDTFEHRHIFPRVKS